MGAITMFDISVEWPKKAQNYVLANASDLYYGTLEFVNSRYGVSGVAPPPQW